MAAQSNSIRNRHLHLDYGYAVTSHSSQGQTADRVLIHVDTELGAKDLLNSRMAYVAVSRGAHDAQIFTNNASALGQELSRDVSHAPAIQQAPALTGYRAAARPNARDRSGIWYGHVIQTQDDIPRIAAA